MIIFGLIQLFSSYFFGMTFACQGGRMLRSGGLSCYDKDQIIRWHNELRSEVAMGLVYNQPPAQNMMEMCWDEELAYKAQSWADNCIFEHNKDRTSTHHFYVGQNMFKSWSYSSYDKIGTGPDFEQAIKSWFNEVNLYGYDGRFRKETGHYSQIIWGETYLVGCGFSCYINGTTYTKLYVCNYGPGGNFARPPYAYGLPECQRYGLSSSINYAGLCDVGCGMEWIDGIVSGNKTKTQSLKEQTIIKKNGLLLFMYSVENISSMYAR